MTVGKNKVIHDLVISYLTNHPARDAKTYDNSYIDTYKQMEQVFEARGNESGEAPAWLNDSDFFTS